MNKCKFEIGLDFLFFWVDGIFFQGIENIQTVCDVLENFGYKYSIDKCDNFDFINNDTEKKVTYLKDGKIKEVFLPKKNNEIDLFLISFLKLHHNKKHNDAFNGI